MKHVKARRVCKSGSFWLLAAATSMAAHAQEAPSETTVPPAPKGRADENAIRQADDAFGVTIGRETIGIYSAEDVRGFSPIAAGNARIDGLYFDQVSRPNNRLRRSINIKVGLSAQGYPFPAPTGVVDYALRRPGSSLLSSATVGFDSFGSKSIEIDSEIPLDGDRLSLGASAGLLDNRFANGTSNRQHLEGVSLRWRPNASIELLPFYGRSFIDDDEIGPLLMTAGSYLPPRIERGRYFGLPWAVYAGSSTLYGLVGTVRFGRRWQIDFGLFNSLSANRSDIFTFLDEIRPDGSARYVAFSDPASEQASLSGELRLTWRVADGPRTHTLVASLRARDRRTRNGGSAFLDFGAVRIGDPLDFAQPPIIYTPQDRDRVRQSNGGLAYSGRWDGVGELGFGLSRTDYSKSFRREGQADIVSRSHPWIYNVTAAVYATRRLGVYGGYVRGLEESGLPPQNTVNRNQPLPAILTSQRDAGIRWDAPGGIKLVVGIFDVRKPYLSLDAAGAFTTLGDVRNRGLEASVSGRAAKGLQVALGGVILDPRVIGESRRLGRTGKRPVGIPLRSIDLNMDWELPWAKRVSLDLGVTHRGRVASAVDNSLFIPDRTLVDAGARYRFHIGTTKATLRVSLSNIFDAYAVDYAGPRTFDVIPGRLLSLYLAADF